MQIFFHVPVLTFHFKNRLFSEFQVRENLYPIVSSTAAKTEMRLGGLKRDFVSLQDRCRAVIISNLGKSGLDSALEGIKLPVSIRQYLSEALHTTAEPTNKYYVLDF